MDKIKKIIPKSLFQFFQPAYHYLLAALGALIYRFPSRQIYVVGITGTKGKTTTTEIVNYIFEEAGFKTAIASTLRFKIGDKEKRNLFKMTMPGRFFMQKFLREAVDRSSQIAIIEMTSEGAKQFRHKFMNIDALIFTNLAPEHIESHGSYAKYLEAKLSIAKELESRKEKFSQKVLACPTCRQGGRGSPSLRSARLFSRTFPSGKTIIANVDDPEGEKFLSLNIEDKIPYSLKDATGIKTDENGSSFQIGKVVIHSKLPGIFNVSNMLGAIALGRFFQIPDETIKKAIEKIDFVRGRMEKITLDGSPPNPLAGGGGFDVVVDYAHTPDSLEAVYRAYENHKKICVLGNTGGGRDKWKRKAMGSIADKYCDEIILTNEDPYDEDPLSIVEAIKEGVEKKQVEIIMDRRKAIREAIKKARALRSDFAKASPDKQAKIAVLITGKGTDPYIMEANGKKTPWDDASVVREELQRIMNPARPNHSGRQES